MKSQFTAGDLNASLKVVLLLPSMYWKYYLTHTIRQNLKIDKEIFLEETEVRIFAISNNLQSFYSVANLAIFILFVKEILRGNTSEMLTSNVGFIEIKDQQCNFVYIWIAYTL